MGLAVAAIPHPVQKMSAFLNFSIPGETGVREDSAEIPFSAACALEFLHFAPRKTTPAISEAIINQ
jgi:hypothetical protein